MKKKYEIVVNKVEYRNNCLKQHKIIKNLKTQKSDYWQAITHKKCHDGRAKVPENKLKWPFFIM